MLKLTDVNKTYPMGDTLVHALRGVSLEIEEGDFVAIMGPSGSGKSTLMHVLGLLDVPTSGSFRIEGREVSKLAEDDLAVLRREVIGFVFQQFNLLPRMSAAQNVSLPLIYSEHKTDLERAGNFLEKVGLGSRAHHRPNELSGGQQQRVAIARSLINQPRLILADEPTGNLDSASEQSVLELLKQLNQQGITIIIVTHEEEIGAIAKRRIRMRDGVVHSDERLAAFSPPPKKSDQAGALRPVSWWSGLGEFAEHFRQSLQTLIANKIRTLLSMLGIMIGVAAVVAMLAIGSGAQQAIQAQMASLGSNLMTLRPGALRVGGVSQGAGGTSRLSLSDADAIARQVAGVHLVSPNVYGGSIQVTYLDKNWSTQIVGASSSYAEMHATDPLIGRFFSEEENLKRARVAVVGATLVRQIFGDKNPIGEMIKINAVLFQVIGVLPEKGANGFRDQDDVIVVPVNTAMKRLLGRLYVDSIDIEATSADNMGDLEGKIKGVVMSRHRIPLSLGDRAFDIFNMADIQAAMSQSSQTMSMLLASIAAISLLVGGIGIMNIMLVSVTERTREIGLRKAVGARRFDILLQFLIEAMSVSAIGGLIGIFFGWAITVSLAWFVGWATSISLASVLLAFFFSASTGIVFGIYPARKASRLSPIDALRFE